MTSLAQTEAPHEEEFVKILWQDMGYWGGFPVGKLRYHKEQGRENWVGKLARCESPHGTEICLILGFQRALSWENMHFMNKSGKIESASAIWEDEELFDPLY